MEVKGLLKEEDITAGVAEVATVLPRSPTRS
jgi:hypothetical protein